MDQSAVISNIALRLKKKKKIITRIYWIIEEEKRMKEIDRGMQAVIQ